MGFADVIRQRVEAQMKQPGGDNPFRKVLNELAEGLTSQDVCATITEGAGARLFLTLWPRTRPTSRHLLLAFSVTGNDIRVYTDPVQVFQNTGDLEACLESFVALPSFLDSLAALVAQNHEPTDGYLRAHSPGKLSGKDVVTVIAPEEQLRLLKEADGSTVTFQVTPDASGPSEFVEGRVYPVFESSGVLVAVSGVQLLDGRLTIEGKKVASPDVIENT